MQTHKAMAGLFAVFLAAACGATAFADSAPAAARGVAVTIPGGTPVMISLVDELSSGNAKPDDRFEFKVLKAVRIDGWLVIAEGARGVGTVKEAEHAGGNGHPGKVQLAFDYVYASDGEKVQLSATNKSEEGEGKKGAASTATIGSYLLLGPLGLFAHNFVHGKEVVISPKQSFDVFVDGTVHVTSTNRDQMADTFAH